MMEQEKGLSQGAQWEGSWVGLQPLLALPASTLCSEQPTQPYAVALHGGWLK